jgi:hypothetical protein
MPEEIIQEDRDNPEVPETTDGGKSPRRLSKAQATVLVLQGAAALIDVISGVTVFLHQW